MKQPILTKQTAARLVLALWPPYTALNTLFPGPAATYAAGLAFAGASLGALRLAGTRPSEAGVRLARISGKGAALMGVQMLFVPLAAAAGRVKFFGWKSVLLEAPASALGQELYFRGALPVALASLLPQSPLAARAAQAALFSLWHVRAFRETTSLPALGVLALTFVGGLLWGAEASRDGTMAPAFMQHTVFLAIQ